MKLELCCQSMSNLTSTPGEKGFSVIPVRAHGLRYFVLQARPVSPEAAEELRKPPGPQRKPVNIAISMDLVLTYCPGCGKRLDELVHGQEGAFDKNADVSSEFRSDSP